MYIDNLAHNYIVSNEPLIFDLVLDGGAFNGFYQLGCLKLLKVLENKKYLKIRRISGVSVGAILGFYYITNRLDDFENDFTDIRNYFRDNLHVGLYRSHLKNRIDLSCVKLDSFQNMLHIAYNNITKGERIVQNTYEDKNDLYEAISRSSHLPKISNGDFFHSYKNECYTDGLYPYIFNNRDDNINSKIIYITLTKLANIKTILSTKKELNISGRIIEGALDMHKLLCLKQATNFCSFVNEWKTIDYIGIRIKHIIYVIIIYILSSIEKARKLLGPKVYEFVDDFYNKHKTDHCFMLIDSIICPKLLWNLGKNVCDNIYKDILLSSCI